MQFRLVRHAVGGVAMALLVLWGGACGDDDAEPPSETCLDETLDYATFGKPFVSSYCASCHGGAVKGNARLGAPADAVFDTQAQIAAKADQIKEQVVVLKAMPFGASSPKPSDQERVKLGRWLDCAAP